MNEALEDPQVNYQNFEQDPADRRLNVRFSVQAKLDRIKTDAEGREIYKDVEYVRILIPGDKTLSVFRPVMPSDKVRFSEQYRAFKAQKGERLVGTALAGWPMITEAQRKELEYFNVFTVEQLAGMADTYAAGMMGIQQLKQAATKFLQTIETNAPTIKLQKELEKRDNEMEVLKAQLQEQSEMLKALMKSKGKE